MLFKILENISSSWITKKGYHAKKWVCLKMRDTPQKTEKRRPRFVGNRLDLGTSKHCLRHTDIPWHTAICVSLIRIDINTNTCRYIIMLYMYVDINTIYFYICIYIYMDFDDFLLPQMGENQPPGLQSLSSSRPIGSKVWLPGGLYTCDEGLGGGGAWLAEIGVFFLLEIWVAKGLCPLYGWRYRYIYIYIYHDNR